MTIHISYQLPKTHGLTLKLCISSCSTDVPYILGISVNSTLIKEDGSVVYYPIGFLENKMYLLHTEHASLICSFEKGHGLPCKNRTLVITLQFYQEEITGGAGLSDFFA